MSISRYPMGPLGLRDLRESRNTFSSPKAQPSADARLSLLLYHIQVAASLIADDTLEPEEARQVAAEIAQLANRAMKHANLDARPSTSPAPTYGADNKCEECDILERLSNRERQIFKCLAEGQSVQEISSNINRSPKTVNNHRTHILKKLGAKNTAELTRLAIRCGIVNI